MFRSRNKRRRPPFDARTPSVRPSRARRLTIEAMESRLLLSGNQDSGNELDGNIWNLDPMGAGYVVISTSSTPPALTSDTVPAGTDGTVPAGMQIDGSLAANIPYATPSLISNLSDYDSYAAIVNLESTLAQANQAQHFTNGAGFTVLRDRAYENPGWSISDLNSTEIQHGITPRGLDDDVRSSGDFNRDGIVNAGDYMVWRDTVDPFNPVSSDMLAYSNWRANFGKRYILDSTTVDSLSDSLPVDRLDVQEHSLSFDVAMIVDISKSSGSLTVGFDAMPGSQGDVFDNATTPILVTTPILELYPDESSADASPLTGKLIADQRLVITIGPVSVAADDDANIATSHSALIFDADGGSHQLVLSSAPVTPARQSGADDDLADAIDELLSEDVILVDHSGEATTEAIADTTPTDVDSSTEVAAAGTSSDGDVVIDQLAEGGMISVEDIVGAVARGSAETASSGAQIVSNDEAADLVGELTRVAVMELIEGEAEPGTPQAAADHVSLLAASDTTTNAQQSTTTSGEQQSVVARVAHVIAEQAGTAASMFAPVNPAYLATIANAASQAFAAVIGAELNGSLGEAALESVAAADAARSEAFSQWGDDDSIKSQAAADNESSRWLDAAPILMALACERVVAAKKKFRQRDPIRQSPKNLRPTDEC